MAMTNYAEMSQNFIKNKKSYIAPVGKIDLGTMGASMNSANEIELWKEVLRFFDYWRIPPIKPK